MVNWNRESYQDAMVLERLDRSLIDARLADGDDGLAAAIGQHNAGQTDFDERFCKLTCDRTAKQMQVDEMLLMDSSSIRAMQDRLLDESWDALVALKKLVNAREKLLGRLKEHLLKRLNYHQDLQDRIVANTRKLLAREHRAYFKSDPIRAEAHVATLADENEAVVEMARQLQAAKEAFESTERMWRQTHADERTITVRQRELIHHLLR